MKIIVVGGGASGIVASIFSKRENNEVIVLEKNNDCLKKVLITGNGKCNYFNDDFNISHYYSDDLFLLSNIINDVNKKRVIDFVNRIGIVPRVKNGYYYPSSNQAYSVHNALIREAKNCGVKINTGIDVLNIKKENNTFFIETNSGFFSCDKVIISTGSCAYPKTGSTGDGFKFARDFGLSINKVFPGLVQLVSNNKFIKEISGVRCDVSVSLFGDDLIKTEVGEVQFTDYGVSGICIYNLSLYVNKLIDINKKVFVYVNFFNDFDVNDVSSFINLIDCRNNLVKNRNITELLEGFLNYKIVNLVLKLCKIDFDLSWDNIPFNIRKQIAQYFIKFPIEIVGSKGYDNAQVCVGGVSLSDIGINSFQSKKVPGLFFTGEVLDVAGECGGYNLGFAFLSGMIVGDSIGDIDD